MQKVESPLSSNSSDLIAKAHNRCLNSIISKIILNSVQAQLHCRHNRTPKAIIILNCDLVVNR